eukprot:1158519-Pelagomonas_calceolata.AAC.4
MQLVILSTHWSREAPSTNTHGPQEPSTYLLVRCRDCCTTESDTLKPSPVSQQPSALTAGPPHAWAFSQTQQESQTALAGMGRGSLAVPEGRAHAPAGCGPPL